jgi:mannitol/fructose-specific phosphotransferase system IIA component (Ntr-type)
MPTLLATTLDREAIRIGYATIDFESAVRGLLAHPLIAHGISPSRIDDIVEAVLRREEAGNTGSGPIALPHARCEMLPCIIAGLGINPNGIWPGAETRLMLAFVSPADAAGDHLRFLSSAAKALRDPDLRSRILEAQTEDDVLALL